MMTNIFCCPDCLTKLYFKNDIAKCNKCHRSFTRKSDIYQLLPSSLSDNKIKEDEVYNLKNLDNSWYNNRIWYYFIHLSSHIIRFEKEFLSKIKGPRVLELASGNGWASMLVKRAHPDFEAYSTDVSFNSLKIQGGQMSKIMEVKPDYFVVCDAEKLPFEDNSFDTVFVIASIHHFFDISQALKEAKRVLKPGGLFIAADGMMPKIAGKLLGDEDSDRTKRFGILERKITFDHWLKYLEEAKIPKKSIKLNYDTHYLHSYPTNTDEKKLIRESWLFNVAKEIIYGAFLSKMKQDMILRLRLTKLFPAGVVIEYYKKRK